MPSPAGWSATSGETGRASQSFSLTAQVKHAHFLLAVKGVDYVFTVKNNQPGFKETLEARDEGAVSTELVEVSKDHGRLERRGLKATSTLNHYLAGPDVLAAPVDDHVGAGDGGVGW